jgi:protein-tyrosine kinase
MLTSKKEKATFIEPTFNEVEYLSPLISQPLQISGHNLGAILVDSGRLKLEDVDCILHFQKEQGLRFGDAALKLKLVNEQDIQHALSKQFSYTYLRPKEGGFSNDLVAAYMPFSAQMEALRAVRSQLMLRWFGEGHKTLAIVSPNAQEGRSYLAANLAVIFSQLGERTLLIDANLRKPRQHSIFNLPRGVGLTSVLSGRSAGQEVVSRIPLFTDLSVLAAGPIPPNPLELLGRPEFSKLLADFNQRYDVVLIDTPAGTMYSDAMTVASRAGGALMVTRKNHTRLDTVKVLTSQLNASGIQMVGGVLNKH